jgi:hypothetical protein
MYAIFTMFSRSKIPFLHLIIIYSTICCEWIQVHIANKEKNYKFHINHDHSVQDHIDISVLLVEETRKNQVTDKLYHIMLHTSPWMRIKLAISVVIGTDCIGSCKSNYHTIASTKNPPSNKQTKTHVKYFDYVQLYIYIFHSFILR